MGGPEKRGQSKRSLFYKEAGAPSFGNLCRRGGTGPFCLSRAGDRTVSCNMRGTLGQFKPIQIKSPGRGGHSLRYSRVQEVRERLRLEVCRFKIHKATEWLLPVVICPPPPISIPLPPANFVSSHAVRARIGLKASPEWAHSLSRSLSVSRLTDCLLAVIEIAGVVESPLPTFHYRHQTLSVPMQFGQA